MLFLTTVRQMVKKIRLISILILFVPLLEAQTGGDNTYEFLNLTHSGLISSLGGTNVSLYTDNLNLAYHNPGLLNSSMEKSLALNYVNYFAGINYGSVMYSLKSSQKGNFAAGLTYLNYGSFTEADPSGNITGKFTASEYAFSVAYSRSIDSLITMGVTFKPVISFLEKYNSVGFAFDLGAGYHNKSGLFSAGLVIKNAGLQITRYAGEPRLPLPFEIQAGASQRLAHAPFRFSLTLRHLEKFDPRAPSHLLFRMRNPYTAYPGSFPINNPKYISESCHKPTSPFLNPADSFVPYLLINPRVTGKQTESSMLIN